MTSLHCGSLHSIVRCVSYRINTFATRIRALFLNNTPAITRVLFKNKERWAHVIYLDNARSNIVDSTYNVRWAHIIYLDNARRAVVYSTMNRDIISAKKLVPKVKRPLPGSDDFATAQ